MRNRKAKATATLTLQNILSQKLIGLKIMGAHRKNDAILPNRNARTAETELPSPRFLYEFSYLPLRQLFRTRKVHKIECHIIEARAL
jgi:hypothetical protein